MRGLRTLNDDVRKLVEKVSDDRDLHKVDFILTTVRNCGNIENLAVVKGTKLGEDTKKSAHICCITNTHTSSLFNYDK